jgi:transcriptional regulator with XRE-family HTH domain
MKLITRIKKVKVIDHQATGLGFRLHRKLREISLRQIAFRMGITAAYLSDLERGYRNWNQNLANRYNKALNQK